MTGALGRWLAKKNTGQPKEDTIQRTVTWDIEKNDSPYPGLFHFTREYAPVFFGRDMEVREILGRMRSPEGRFILQREHAENGRSHD
jgi:hypothetical protein